MELPRPGVKSELHLPACTTATATQIWATSHVCDLHHSSWQRWILNPLSEARDQTHNLMVPSRIHFLWATTGTTIFSFFFFCALIPSRTQTSLGPSLSQSSLIYVLTQSSLSSLTQSSLTYVLTQSSLTLPHPDFLHLRPYPEFPILPYPESPHLRPYPDFLHLRPYPEFPILPYPEFPILPYPEFPHPPSPRPSPTLPQSYFPHPFLHSEFPHLLCFFFFLINGEKSYNFHPIFEKQSRTQKVSHLLLIQQIFFSCLLYVCYSARLRG